MDAGVRIVAISGALHATTHFRVLKHIGVRATLHKPFTATDLRAAIASAFGDMQ
jgi:hypothetical protein